MSRILVCDDEPQILRALRVVLRDAGFEVELAETAEQALDRAALRPPDAAILDLLLPDGTGVEVCRRLREWSQMPILVLSAVGEEDAKVAALEAGADDYITKPFKPQELVARVRARLRRGDDVESEALTLGDLTIDVSGHVVQRAGVPILLTPLEFDLLVALARKPWQVFSRETLLEQVWGYRHAGDTRLVNVHVQRLRSKVEKDPENPEIVLTVRGVGYKAGPA